MNAPTTPAAPERTCAHVAASGPRCRCGHVDVLHNLSTDNSRRTDCTISTGPKAKRCPCKKFELEVTG